MDLQYNSIIYCNLIKYDQLLQKTGTSLEEKNERAYRKLLKYSVRMSDHIHWKERYIYLDLIENFVNGIINAEQFDKEFQLVYKKTEQKR